MKKLIIILTAAILLLSSCHKAIWDKLNDHEARIAKLEAFCNQLNTNILSLQSIVDVINARDYVKDVVPINENGKVIGYAITFANSNPVTIYNGKNGEDGHTPGIGIKSENGVWYWTLDGEWILDDKGNRVRAGGQDTITPKLKIEEDYWWISYDNGATWEKLGKALDANVSDECMIKDITQDDKYVYLTLASGEVIQLAKTHSLTWVYV